MILKEPTKGRSFCWLFVGQSQAKKQMPAFFGNERE
jgi:hypothetical protein